MQKSRLIPLTYYDEGSTIRLSTFADTLVLDGEELCAVRFGGYPEMVPAMSDAIYGGATVEAKLGGESVFLTCRRKQYQRQYSRDSIYATATLLIRDEEQTIRADEEDEEKIEGQTQLQPRKCYLFCPAGDRERLFEELDHKTAAPLIPEFRDYVLEELENRGILTKLFVASVYERMEAWRLDLLPNDENVVEVLEDGLKSGRISIPGAQRAKRDGFEEVNSVTGYLNAFGVTVAERIRHQFRPLFDPSLEPLSEEVLAINDFIREKAGYSLYDAQLAVAEAVKRQLGRSKLALIIAECGSGKSKIGSVAMAAALTALQKDQQKRKQSKTFNLVMCPSHVTKKWVREIGETLPNTYAMVVRSITDFNRLYELYEQGDKSVFAVFSKEKARDGYMKAPAIRWHRRKKAFLCPDCGETVEMDIGEGSSHYYVPADQFFFQRETRKNHKCKSCGSPLWMPAVPGQKMEWVKLGAYGWVHRKGAKTHLAYTENETLIAKLEELVENPECMMPTVGAVRRYPLSSYIKKKMRGRIDGAIVDELHQYNNDSGQGEAMGEIYQTARKVIGMTATLINGYSSGIFYLLYRILPRLMQQDGKSYKGISEFNTEYGVTETTYTIEDPHYAANRRAVQSDRRTRQLPGVSPLVFSRFLLEYAAFLSLSDMGKDLPDYEEIPVPLAMPEDVGKAYKELQDTFKKILKERPKIKNKVLSAFLGLLTVFPDQPYEQKPVLDPENGFPLVEPPDLADFSILLPKEEEAVMEIVDRKIAAGERVLIYTSWVRTDSQQKLLKLLRDRGYRTDILEAKVPPTKREEWVEKRVESGVQVLITNPTCVETGLDLNAFTTLIFYSMGYNLFTLRQAARRSWRINQMAPRVEVYLLYYMDTMQAKAMKLMASKLAVAGLIEGNFTDEGLAAMSDVKDMASQMAKELMLGIKDNVEDIAAAYKKMAIINTNRRPAPPCGAIQEISTPAPADAALETMEAVQALPITPASDDHTPGKTMYAGLLERTLEEQQKRPKKKVVVDENQLSLFDWVA